ncbi:MAG: WG repeat-containing protein [Bacteroidales bacterium]
MKSRTVIFYSILLLLVPNSLRSREYIAIASQKGKYGFIDTQGKWLIDPDYDAVTGFYNGLAAVKTGNTWGYIDHRGEHIISGDFDKAGPFADNGYAMVQVDGIRYYVDIRGNIIPCQEAIVFHDGLALYKSDGKYGYLGTDLQWKIPPVFDKAWPFSEGYARVKRNHRWYYINKSGYEKFLPSRSRSFKLEGNPGKMIRRKSGNKWGFADMDGEWIVPPVFDYVKSFCEGFAPVEMKGEWGYINRVGELVIDASYEDACKFSSGLASVRRKGLYGCIDSLENLVIKPKFAEPLYFFPLEKFNPESEVFSYAGPGVIPLDKIVIPEAQVSGEVLYSPDDKRLALVIGNSNYRAGDHLNNPEHDARDMAETLERLGFTVHIHLNATQLGMKQAIDDFGEQLRDYDVGLFFYAGHGIQYEEYNYLVPVDAEIKRARDVEYTCVEAGRVLTRMEDSGADANIVILDACRNSPFGKGWTKDSHGQGLAFMTAPSGSLIAYATAPGTTASDGPGENGMYTSSLLKHIVTPGISMLEIFQLVRAEVKKVSGGKQVPWESTSLEGNFYFRK